LKKKQISEEAKKAQQELSKKALNERLSLIDVSEYELKQYDQYVHDVANEIKQLRAILEAVQAKDKERNWMKRKGSGELDDSRLVEGITGDRLIYKKRGKEEQFQGGFQEKPKRLRFVMDISGSMYRFNGQDKRLDRLIQVTAMIMESLEGFEHKYQYSIVGHSGDHPEIPLVDYGKPVNSVKDRLKIFEKMTAHSQYCGTGDFTVEATKMAIENVLKEDADDYFVFVFSDANLARYGINPDDLGKELIREPLVNSYVIFIASFVNEAERIMKELPTGKAFVCLDPSNLPFTFKQTFSTAINED